MLSYWVYAWQVALFWLDSMKIECTAYNCVPLVTRRNFHRLPPGYTHFKLFPHYPDTLCTESCRDCSYYKQDLWYSLLVPPHWVGSYIERYKYFGMCSYTRTYCEPHSLYSTKPKWNIFSIEILFCRGPKMLIVTPAPSATKVRL